MNAGERLARRGRAARPARLGHASPTAKGGYVWADQPTSPSYVPNTAYQYNSLGGTNTILRSRTGGYDVTFPGLGGAGGAIDLTTYGGVDVYCAVDGLAQVGADEHLHVDCASPAEALDVRFTLAWTTAVSGTAGRLAYAANLPQAGMSYDSAGGRPTNPHRERRVPDQVPAPARPVLRRRHDQGHRDEHRRRRQDRLLHRRRAGPRTAAGRRCRPTFAASARAARRPT